MLRKMPELNVGKQVRALCDPGSAQFRRCSPWAALNAALRAALNVALHAPLKAALNAALKTHSAENIGFIAFSI